PDRHGCTTCGQTCGHAAGTSTTQRLRGGGPGVDQPSNQTDLAQLWTTIVEGTAPAQRVWLATSKPVMHAEHTFVIAVPNEFTQNQYASKLRTWVEDTLTEHLGHPTRLVVTID